MALPITIVSGGAFVAPCGGPFKSGTSFYIVAFSSTATALSAMEVYKADSDDPSSGWTAQDTSNGPSPGRVVSSMHSVLDGTTIHIVTQTSDTSSAPADVQYHTFDCSTDSWSVTDESVTTAPDTTIEFCSIDVRSDGDVIAVYQGAQESNMGTGYDRIDLARREGGTWTADISVDNLGKTTTHMRYPFVGMSANDRAHIFYHDVTGNVLHYSTYLSGNTWGHQHTTADSSPGTSGYDGTDTVRAINFDDGGTEKIRAFYRDSGNVSLSVVGFNDADNPGSSISIATDITGTRNSGQGHTYAADGNTQHQLYKDDAGALYHNETGSGNDTWSGDNLELSSITSLYSANIYDNGGTVLAYLYLDGSNYRYNERTLAAAATSLVYKPNRNQHMKVR